jgi:hypothetical protein
MIENTRKYIEDVIGRKLTHIEILIFGMAYNGGFIDGKYSMEEENKDKK